ncbi:MAG: hypothetical protein GPOALKHO_001761 [Sodalis sp.]|nr:MAG: hypothetical protein GPOALKHO_001761 [Sodalis sp.]
MLAGGHRKPMTGDLAARYYLEPTILFSNNSMRVFQGKSLSSACGHNF